MADSLKFYVAGPMRGYDQFNFPEFDRITSHLRMKGYDVINPAEIDRELGFDETLNDLAKFDELGGIEAAMHRDFGAILECDGIVLLSGWQASAGARAEVFIAQTTGRSVYEYQDRWEEGDQRYAGHLYWSGFDLVEIAETGVELVSTVDKQPGPSVAEVEWVGDGEVRIVNELTGGEKGSKLARFDLIPAEPLSLLAEHYGRGARKYEDRNWERGYDWSLSFAALNRHLWAFWGGEDIDPETGGPHLAAVAWHAFVLLEFGRTHADLDDRPAPRA